MRALATPLAGGQEVVRMANVGAGLNLRCEGCGSEWYATAAAQYDGTRCEKCGGVVRVIDRTRTFLRALAQRQKASNPNRRSRRRLG